MFGKLGMAIHDGGGGGNAEAVRRADHVDPLPYFQLIGTQRAANFIVENFRGRSRNAAQTGFPQHQEIVAQRQARLFDAISDFHGRKSMHMKFRQAGFDGAKEFDVVVSVQIFRETALNAHFGGAAIDGLERFGQQRIGGMKISIRRIGRAAEPAKSAAHDTDVGEIQISVHHVGDFVADHAPAQFVGDFYQRQEVGPLDVGQGRAPARNRGPSRQAHSRGGRQRSASPPQGRVPREFLSIQDLITFSIGHDSLERNRLRHGACKDAAGDARPRTRDAMKIPDRSPGAHAK